MARAVPSPRAVGERRRRQGIDILSANPCGGVELSGPLNSSGKVVMLRHEKGSASVTEREAGFIEAPR